MRKSRFISVENDAREEQHGGEGDAGRHGGAKHAIGGDQQRTCQ